MSQDFNQRGSTAALLQSFNPNAGLGYDPNTLFGGSTQPTLGFNQGGAAALGFGGFQDNAFSLPDGNRQNIDTSFFNNNNNEGGRFNMDTLAQGLGIGRDILGSLIAIKQFKAGQKALDHSIALDRANLANSTAIAQADLNTQAERRNIEGAMSTQTAPTLQTI